MVSQSAFVMTRRASIAFVLLSVLFQVGPRETQRFIFSVNPEHRPERPPWRSGSGGLLQHQAGYVHKVKSEVHRVVHASVKTGWDPAP
jgi:hypothetical protein